MTEDTDCTPGAVGADYARTSFGDAGTHRSPPPAENDGSSPATPTATTSADVHVSSVLGHSSSRPAGEEDDMRSFPAPADDAHAHAASADVDVADVFDPSSPTFPDPVRNISDTGEPLISAEFLAKLAPKQVWPESLETHDDSKAQEVVNQKTKGFLPMSSGTVAIAHDILRQVGVPNPPSLETLRGIWET